MQIYDNKRFSFSLAVVNVFLGNSTEERTAIYRKLSETINQKLSEQVDDQTSAIISRVWGTCNPLQDNGVSNGDYLEQFAYLIFLKMVDEYAKPPL